MPTLEDSSRRLRTIHRLSLMGQIRNREETLEQIAAIASGKADPILPILAKDNDLTRRLEEGMASRSPRVGDRKPVAEEKKARRERAGRDRSEKSRRDRSLDYDPDKIDKTTDLNV